MHNLDAQPGRVTPARNPDEQLRRVTRNLPPDSTRWKTKKETAKRDD